MITSLSDMTMKDFISLVCGEHGVLLKEGEKASEEELRSTASELIYRYRMIVSPASARAGLMDIEDSVKIKSRDLLVKILRAMNAMGKEDEVRSILAEVGRTGVKDIPAALDSMHAECEYLRKKHEDSKPKAGKQTPSEIRESFDAECAYLMTFFKMQISLDGISAGVYANMLHQAEEQIRMLKRKK